MYTYIYTGNMSMCSYPVVYAGKSACSEDNCHILSIGHGRMYNLLMGLVLFLIRCTNTEDLLLIPRPEGKPGPCSQDLQAVYDLVDT